jgi:hypothetical protein
MAAAWSRPRASDAVGELEWIVSVDATVNRAHQHAAGARRRPAQEGAKGGCRAVLTARH